MPTTNRSAVASVAAAPWIIAAAAVFATLAATLLLRPTTGHAAGTAATVVSTGKTGLGRVLVDSRGRTLYMFGKDRNGKSACAGMCATFWPPVIAKGKPHAVGGTKASLLGTTKRPDGRLQATYKHHPLYAFVKDTKRGQTNGEGVRAFGDVWDAVSPAGVKVVKRSSSPGAGPYGP
jgi:predicted lipoprotein with Yx(FWY)xxD motif